MSCKDCLHYEICEALYEMNGISKIFPSQCSFYKNNKMNNWISVKDRLPKPHDRVLCYFKFEPESPDVIGENTYIGNKIWMSESTGVTHWMPLPEPPKGE